MLETTGGQPPFNGTKREEQHKPPVVNLITMGAVRGEDCKRGVPLDMAKVIAVAPRLAEILATSGRQFDLRNPAAAAPLMSRLHLVGDVSKLAVYVAQQTGATVGYTAPAIAKLRRLLESGDKDDAFENALEPFTREKVEIAKILAERLGQPDLPVESSIAYLRVHPQIAKRMMDIMEMVYKVVMGERENVSVDVGAMRLELAGESLLPPGHNELMRSVRGVVYRTLPSRLRRLDDRGRAQLQQTFYGVSEAALAAALVEVDEANVYASYRGSDISSCSPGEITESEGKVGTIIENMRLLVMMVLYETIRTVPLVRDRFFPLLKSVNDRFYIHNILDGIGLKRCRKKGLASQIVRCDPWTLDKRNGDSDDSTDADSGLVLPFSKIPLIVVGDDGQLRPPKAGEEINPILAATKGVEYIVLHNLIALYEYLMRQTVGASSGSGLEQRSFDNQVLKILRINRISVPVFENWLGIVKKYLDARLIQLSEEEGGEKSVRQTAGSHLFGLLFPEHDHRVIGDLISAMSKGVLGEYARRRQSPVSSSPPTVVAMRGSAPAAEADGGAVEELKEGVDGADKPGGNKDERVYNRRDDGKSNPEGEN